MNNIKNNDLIEKYFDNELSPSEQKIFERKARKDPDFAEALAFREELESYFQYETKVKRLDRTMERVEEELELKNKSKEINWYKKFSVAASILLLIGFGFTAWQLQEQQVALMAVSKKNEGLEKQLKETVAQVSESEKRNANNEKLYEEQRQIANAKINELKTIEKQQVQKNNQQLLAYQNLEKQFQNAQEELSQSKLAQAKQAQNMAALNLVNNTLKAENQFRKSPRELTKIEEEVEKLLSEPLASWEPNKRGNKGVNILLQAGVEKYKNKDYKNAIADFDQLLQLKPDDDEALFYKGICYKCESPDHYPEAISIFENLLNQENGHHKEDVLQWQLALLYANTKQYQKAKGKLEEIVEMVAPVHERKADAEGLLAYF